MSKKRPPRKQLLEAGKFARGILEERKLILPKHQSAIDRIRNTVGAPMLPINRGQYYLPRPWTINLVRRMVRDVARIYLEEMKKNPDSKKMVGNNFFKFVLQELNRVKSKVNVLIDETVKTEEYNRMLLNKKETIEAVKIFLVDSFAIAVVAKQHIDVADYIEWFDSWSISLRNLWSKNEQFIDSGKKIITQ